MTTIPIEHDHTTMWDWPMQHNDEFVFVRDDENKFEVDLDATLFTPKEIEVKAIGDIISIHCGHDAKKGELGTTSREITRCYHLPSDVDMKSLKSNLDNKGILHIHADKKH